MNTAGRGPENIWAFLAIVGLLLVTVSVAPREGQLVVTGSERVSTGTPSFWDWIERGSWVSALIGVPIGIYQLHALRLEQRRIARELARRPKLKIGLGIKMTSTARYRTKGIGAWVTVDFKVENQGDKTARDILLTLYVPDTIRHRDLVPITSDLASMDFQQVDLIHSGASHLIRTELQFNKINEDLKIHATLICADGDPERQDLYLGAYTDTGLARRMLRSS